LEELRAGDLLPTRSGRLAPIVWLGEQRTHASPVRVQAHAFGDGAPHADLLLSPDHAVFAGGALIPVRYLVNGASVRIEAARTVRFFHVELASHDVILANGLAAETYLDTGNRHAFVGAASARRARCRVAPAPAASA
jgi:hypothetical protein